MTLVARECLDGWGVDTAAKLSAAQLGTLASMTYHGHPLFFLWRYGPLPGNSFAADLDSAELEAALAVFQRVGLVQHVLNPGWTASGQLGALHGATIARHASVIGYPKGAHVALDLEGLKNSGQFVADHVAEWARSVTAAGYQCAVYEGYAAGLSSEEIACVPGVTAMWSDYGPRAVPACGFAMKQHAQGTIAGIGVDPDEAFADTVGRRVVMASLPGDPHESETVDPAMRDTIPPTEKS